jgi:hypothetical protein
MAKVFCKKFIDPDEKELNDFLETAEVHFVTTTTSPESNPSAGKERSFEDYTYPSVILYIFYEPR